MSRTPQNHDAARHRSTPDEQVTYPEHHVLAVLDSEDELAAAVRELTSGGFLDSEVQVGCGTERADALRATTGRGGLAGLAIRIADRLGIEDPEMETKRRYERAMREGRYVLRVLAPSEDRKARVVEIPSRHGAHGISYFGPFTIERIVPHRQS